MTSRERIVRVVFALVVVACLVTVVAGAVNNSVADSRTEAQRAFDAGSDEQLVEPRSGATVIVSDRRFNGQMKSALVAYAPDGSVLHFTSEYTNYQDVDPAPTGRRTVEYLAAERIPSEECASTHACSRMVFERLNLTTGETTRLFSHTITARTDSIQPAGYEWHDADRIGDDRFLVGDIRRDSVKILNTTTGLVEWEWIASTEYSFESGGGHPGDWTHLNDVERLPDGRYMASVRNQDEVVFLDPETGLQPEWTLGEDDEHDILYEQHNPDFIPETEGGPAVVVADSENNRVVEYQFDGSQWNRTWTWSGSTERLQWPRDADRLPNGNTLIADSNGNRVVETAPNGSVVWSVTVSNPYDVERLGTGPESTGGPSATAARLESSRVTADGDGSDGPSVARVVVGTVRSLLPGPVVNGVLFVLPTWVNVPEALALGVLGVTLIAWTSLELWWRYTFDASLDVDVRRR